MRTLIILVAVFFLKQLNAQSQKILGQWINSDSSQIVEIYKTTEGKYNAKLVYLDHENAVILLDTENDDTELKKRKVLFLDVWTNFEYIEEKDMWKNGRIYNYKTGNVYKGKIQVEENELKLTGYYGFFFFLAKTQKWQKV